MKNVAFATALVALIVALPEAAHSDRDRVTPPAVPANLEVPEGNTPFLLGHADGTQNYICLQTASGFSWTFFGPQATLFDDKGRQIATHYLSPNPAEDGTPRATWQDSRDTSSVWAATTPAQTSTDSNYVAPGAIPWLRLETKGTQYGPRWGDNLARTTYIQRVNTAGGIAPATGCAAATDIGRKALVPYTTDYVFYKERRDRDDDDQ